MKPLRPLASARTEDLLYELQQRQVLGELGGQIMMPDTAAMAMDEAAVNALRLEQFKAMAAQMGQQIAQSGWAFAGIQHQPNVVDPTKQDEILKMSILIVRHPANTPAGGVDSLPEPVPANTE